MGWSTDEQRLAIPGAIRLSDGPDGDTLEICHPSGRASISRQGAQLLSFVPAGERDIIWLSPQAMIGTGRSIRGGTPVCWPWFADHPSDPSKPSHGFARNRQWALTSSEASDACHRIALSLEVEPGPLWPHSASLVLDVAVSDEVELVLTTRNTGEEDFVLSSALHTYFAVSDISAVSIEGLENVAYIDKLLANRRMPATGHSISFRGEVDRIYLGTVDEIAIYDQAHSSPIRVTSNGSRSTVVWNPAAQKAERLGDLGQDGWRRFVCVETANAGDDTVALAPGQLHTLKARYRIG